MSMKGFSFGTIRFDEPRAIYYSGQVLSGTLQFELEQPVTFTAIKVHYTGQASVSWEESQTEKYGGVERTRQIKYVGNEQYIDNVQCLLGNGVPTLLPTGPHTINFSYPLPYNIPSSFNGEKGIIKYCVTAYLEYPGGATEGLMSDFDVVAPLDLNTVESLKKPLELEYEEVSSCNLFCQNEPIIIQVTVPASGYCPGQVIPIQIHAQNDSSVEISKLIFKLVQKVKYLSTQPVASYVPPEQVLGSAHQGPVLARTRRSLTCALTVPELIAYNTQACSIIDIAYFIKIKIKMSGCLEDCEDQQEISIGLVPLQETETDSYTHPLSHLLPLAPVPDQRNQFNPQQYEINKNVVETNSGYRPYDIGFKVPVLPVINNAGLPYSNLPQPSAPPLP